MEDRSKLFKARMGWGRVWLVLIWLVLRALDIAFCFGLKGSHNAQLPIFVVSDVIWTTAMLVALGCRQAWAWFGLIAIVALGVAWDVIQIALGNGLDPRLLIADGAVRLLVILFVCRSWNIKRLTSRAYE